MILFRRSEAGEDPILHVLRRADARLRLLLEYVQRNSGVDPPWICG
jgi:hypothetical protein